MGELPVKLLDRSNHLLDALPLPVKTAVAEDTKFFSLFFFLDRIKNLGVDPTWSFVTANAVFLFDPSAEAFRISKQGEALSDDLFFFFMTLEQEIEILSSCPEPLKLG